jgi:hypothetical protein
MRTTIDIPDPLFRELKIRAASEGTTLREMVIEGLSLRVGEARVAKGVPSGQRFPRIHAKHPGSLNLGEEGVYEYIPFP